MSEITAKQKIEIEFWHDSDYLPPKVDAVYSIVNTLTEAGVFLNSLHRHQKELTTNGRVLELGAGQGWASCIYKRLFPDTHVTATDISKFAVSYLPGWERLFEVKIDNSYACTSYNIDEEDAACDFVFCFAAAHHFLAHKRTLKEINRVLKAGGKAIYFHEPTSPKYFYYFAHWNINRSRPEVPEDVLIISELSRLARETSLDMHVDYYPSIIKRGPFKAYQAVSIIRDSIPFLQHFLPSAANLIFTKNEV